MKVCIPGSNQGIGGPNSFKRNFIKQLTSLGIDVDTGFSTADIDVVLLVGGTRNIKWLKKIRRSNIPIVQRLGPINWLHKYTPITSKHKWMSIARNSLLFKIRENFADFVVYQSQFCKNWWTEVRGPDKNDNVVIYNGVDTTMFNPGPRRAPGSKVRLVSVEGNLSYTPQVYKTPLQVTDLLNSAGLDVELTLVGDINKEGLDEIYLHDRTEYLGNIPHSDVRDILINHDLFVSGEIHPACPNSPLEAMACGLPVVGFDTGALSELIIDNSGLCAAYESNAWKLESPNMDNLVNAVLKVTNDISNYSDNALANIQNNFTLGNMTNEYVKVFQTVI